MESKKINQLATELAPDLSDLTIIGDPTTGISKKITLSQMASLFTGTVEEYANFAAFPLVGVADTIYIAKDTNVIYRWDSTAYVVLSPNIIASLVFNDANGFDGTIALVGSVATLTITTALTTGSVGFIGASGALLQDNANFFWDDTNNRLGLGTNAPTTALDVFGSGIIGRINGTSTNNSYLGFASNGTNKWSAGNVQSDHRFRIFSEANSAELITILQTGEFGIGIANPTTKFHIDGGATALIANLDANVSVAKSLSFRSDNSNRFNIEVSGTESGSNAGADLFIRRYSDAGSLIDTPLTITRSTGNATFSGILITPQVKAATSAGLSINANSGTQVADFGAGGSANITFFGGLSGTSATFSGLITYSGTSQILNAASGTTGYLYQYLANTTGAAYFGLERSTGGGLFTGSSAYATVLGSTTATSLEFGTNGIIRLTIASTGQVGIGASPNASFLLDIYQSLTTSTAYARIKNNRSRNAALQLETSLGNFLVGVGIGADTNKFQIYDNTAGADRLFITSTGIVVIGGSAASRKLQVNTSGNDGIRIQTSGDNPTLDLMQTAAANVNARNWRIVSNWEGWGTLDFQSGTTNTQDPATTRLTISGVTGNVGIGGGDSIVRLNIVGAGATSATYSLYITNSTPTQLFGIRDDGVIFTGAASRSPYNDVSAAGANLIVVAGGNLQRSTSSLRFKTNVENLYEDTSSLIYKMRPIWYRSLGHTDRKDWSWYGFIAEELAEIEPRLVHWGYDISAYEEIEIIDEEGNTKKETKLKEDAILIPDGVQYERISVLLVSELQKMRKELDELKAKIK